MRSIKPGRGPSLGGAVAGIAVAIGGVCWIVFAGSMGAPLPFLAFGVVFVLMAVGGSIYNFYNAGAKNRFSAFDITEEGEEVDPLERKRPAASGGLPGRKHPGEFCPFCGKPAERDHDFCPHCGKDI